MYSKIIEWANKYEIPEYQYSVVHNDFVGIPRDEELLKSVKKINLRFCGVKEVPDELFLLDSLIPANLSKTKVNRLEKSQRLKLLKRYKC